MVTAEFYITKLVIIIREKLSDVTPYK